MKKSDRNCFKGVNRDALIDIMSRLDGCTLASVASTCNDLRGAAGEESLWKEFCYNTWPSTSAIKTASFKCLYTDAFPLILYEEGRSEVPQQQMTSESTPPDSSLWSSPSGFTSLVDIYYKGHCIFSKVVDGMTARNESETSEGFKRFLCYPFSLDLLGIGRFETSDHVFDQNLGIMEDDTTNSLLAAFTGYNKRGGICSDIAQNIQLSWILWNARTGRAVNISSWKPRSICRNNPFVHEDFFLCFGCIVPAEDSSIIHKLTEFEISVKCKLLIEQGCIIWKEISLIMKDIDGSHLNGQQSMRAFNRALICSRSINHSRVEKGYQHFQNQKILHRIKIDQEELISNLLSATVAIASLLGICYACGTLL
ncbi:probable F-box protein At2g36090 [Primulina huaijiensis]|uniref:probable F-box protein At2g36090 n=1 Tax=Primulina huaijiensis TaxID=1492673 RepID=UPI003CC73E64